MDNWIDIVPASTSFEGVKTTKSMKLRLSPLLDIFRSYLTVFM